MTAVVRTLARPAVASGRYYAMITMPERGRVVIESDSPVAVRFGVASALQDGGRNASAIRDRDAQEVVS